MVQPNGVPGVWNQLIFQDEFPGNSLDLTKWRPNWLEGTDGAVSPPVNGFEVAYYNPSQVVVAGGVCTITAQACAPFNPGNGTNYSFVSGIIESDGKFNFTYGCFEARIQLPPGTNQFPAFWSTGQNWPVTGEIDVVEASGSDASCSYHYHYSDGAGGANTFGANSTVVGSTSGMHTYGVNWQPTFIEWYYDGVRVARVNNADLLNNQVVTSFPQFLILNLGLQPSPTTEPTVMIIDYVRVWKTGVAFPTRAQRGYNNVPYPRIATTNSMGNGGNVNGGSAHYTAETYKRFGLNIVANASVDPTALKNANGDSIALFYQNVVQMQVDAIATGNSIVAGQVIWPGWWLTNVGTTLVAALSGAGGTGISLILNGQPPVGFFGGQPAQLITTAIVAGSTSHVFAGVVVPGTANSWATMAAYTNGASVLIDTGANFEVVTISAVSVTATQVTFTATYTKSHAIGCFIGLLPFPILVSNSADHSKDEVMVVTGQTAANTYTVTRGTSGSPVWSTPYGTATVPPTHAIGDRVATLITMPAFTTTFYLNITAFCPPCPLSTGTPNQLGQRWADYFTALVATTIGLYNFTDVEGMTRAALDGLFIDSANTFPNPALAWADADVNNLGDVVGGDGPSPGPLLYPANASALQGQGLGRGIYNGILYALRSLRSLTSNQPQIILTNGSNYPMLSDGIYWESMQADSSSPKPPAIFLYRMLQQAGMAAAGPATNPVTIYNYELQGANNLAGTQTVAGQTGAQAVYKNFRLYFTAMTCLTSGFFCLDWGTAAHGQTWMMDEFDNAAGSALTVAMTTAATTITVANGAKFSNGQTIRIPMDKSTSPSNLAEDEVMTISGIAANVLTVTRGITYNGVVQTKGTGQVGAKVFTLAQQNAGQGWMGNPRGAATNLFASLGANVLLNPGFETATPGVGSPPKGATFTSWTVSNTAYALDGSNAYAGYATADSAVKHGGNNSVRFVTTVPFRNAFYDLNIQQIVSGLSAAIGSPWTFSFWAKADHGQTCEVRMTDQTNAFTMAVVYIQLTPVWTQYWVTGFVGGVASTSIRSWLGCASENGTVWMDDCSFQSGDPNLFTRDFDNAFVICNATSTSQVVTLPAVTGPWTTYKKLAGAQDTTTNDGTTHAPGTTVTVPALDGLVLVKA